jgi:hypothetical protein
VSCSDRWQRNLPRPNHLPASALWNYHLLHSTANSKASCKPVDVKRCGWGEFAQAKAVDCTDPRQRLLRVQPPLANQVTTPSPVTFSTSLLSLWFHCHYLTTATKIIFTDSCCSGDLHAHLRLSFSPATPIATRRERLQCTTGCRCVATAVRG